MADSPLARVSAAAERQLELMSVRDRKLFMGLIAFATFAGLLMLVVTLKSSLDDKASRVRLAKENLVMAQQFQGEFRAAAAQLADQENRLRQYTTQPISAKIEAIASQRGVLEQLRSVNENGSEIVGNIKQTSYSVDFKGMPIESAIGFLYDLETDPYPVSVNMADMKVSKSRDGKTMSLTLEVVVFKLAEG